MIKNKHIALKNALDYVKELAEVDEVGKTIVIRPASQQKGTLEYDILEICMCAAGPCTEDEVWIVDMRFSRFFDADYKANASVISEALHRIEIPGKVELTHKQLNDGTVGSHIEAYYEDLTEAQFIAIIEAYLSAMNYDDIKLDVEVTEEQGDLDDTKWEDEDYAIFFADGNKDAYSRPYPMF